MTDPAVQPITYTDYLSYRFIQNYRAMFGNAELVNDPMEAAYINVKIWAQAVELAKSFEVDAVCLFDLLYLGSKGRLWTFV